MFVVLARLRLVFCARSTVPTGALRTATPNLVRGDTFTWQWLMQIGRTMREALLVTYLSVCHLVQRRHVGQCAAYVLSLAIVPITSATADAFPEF